MPATRKFPLGLFVLCTALPALVVGAGLWWLASFVPSCATVIAARLTSPDNVYDLVVFSRTCGESTGDNVQAALIPAGDALPDDATSFLSLGAMADLAPRWVGSGAIELSLPPASRIYRQDVTVAGIAVTYR